MSGYSQDILDSLTDEERLALQDDDDTTSTMGDGDGANSGTDGDGDDKNGGGEDGKGQQGDKGAEGGSQTEADGGDDAGADKKGAETDAGNGGGDDAGKQPAADTGDAATAKQPDPIVPLLVAEAPADAEAKLKEISDKKASLLEQFDNGDITVKEYHAGLDTLNKDERAIERALDKANTAAEMRQQQEMNAWLGTVKDFTNKVHPEYSTSRSRWMALDSFVKEIANANPNMDGGEILRQAHEKVVSDLGEAPKADAGKQGDKKEGKPLKGSKIDPPPTLGKVPASDNADINEGKYAALDRLADTDPLALEEKLMKMSAADRDEYLASRG